MNTRRAASDDIEGIDRCNRSVLSENYTKETYEKLFSDEAVTSIFVVENEGDIVAYIILFAERVKNKVIGHVMSLGVMTEYRRQGHGRNLLITAQKDMIERYNIANLRLHVRKSNKTAQALYMKLGYGRKKKIKNYYGDGEDAFYMELIAN
jgi:ribosomal protein S18 acetylase RimI-like enzyme